MVLDEESDSSIVTTVVNVPTRALGNSVDQEELKQRRKALENRGDTPRPVVVDTEGTVGCPGCNDRTEVPGRVVERGERRTVSGVSQLSDEQGSGSGRKGETESDEETSANLRYVSLTRDCVT